MLTLTSCLERRAAALAPISNWAASFRTSDAVADMFFVDGKLLNLIQTSTFGNFGIN